MDESTNGVICFTFGSSMSIETMSKENLIDLYKTFSKLAPTRVIIKIANKELLPAGLPSNVKTLSWLPQSAILGKIINF